MIQNIVTCNLCQRQIQKAIGDQLLDGVTLTNVNPPAEEMRLELTRDAENGAHVCTYCWNALRPLFIKEAP